MLYARVHRLAVFADWGVNVPLTAWPSPGWALHGNVGWEHDDRGAFTWGLGTDRAVSDRVHLIGEVFGDHRDDPSVQGGVRMMMPAGAVDAGVARGLRSGGRWQFAVGGVFEF